MRRAAALACAAWLVAPSSFAQSTSDDLARRHFDSGVAYLEESDYDSALKAFQKAYELSKRPQILLNIATVHERRSDLPAAVTALKAYLEADPQGEHVETVKLRIQNLEKRLAEQESAKTPPPPPEPAPAPAVAPAPALVTPEPPPEPPRSSSSRLPAFIVLGVGGVMATGALVTGIVAKSKYDDAEGSCSPHCTDDELSSSRTFAITSTVFTGAAVLGVGLGVALLLSSDGEQTSVGAAPHVDVALAPGVAAASAQWSF